MFIAIISGITVGAVFAAALPDEPAKIVVGQPFTSVRTGETLNFVDGATMNRVALDLVGASTTPIGIDVKAVDPPLKAHLKLDGGALVARVVPESDAAKAGINMFDVVVRLEGQTVPDAVWLQKSLENPTLGKKAGDGEGALYVTTLDLVREAKPIKVELRRTATPQVALTTQAFIDFTIADRKPLGEITVDGTANGNVKETFRLGVSLAEADEVLRSQLKLADRQGLVVTRVVPDSPAAKAGVAKNDVIVMFDKSPTLGVEELTARLQKIGDKPTTMVLQRAGQKLDVEVQPKKDDPVQLSATLRERSPNEVAEVISDLLILTDKDGKRFAVTGRPTDLWATTAPQRAEAVEVTGKAMPSIEAEIKELRQTVDRLQAELARIDKERVVEKLQSTIARLESALKEGERAKTKK